MGHGRVRVEWGRVGWGRVGWDRMGWIVIVGRGSWCWARTLVLGLGLLARDWSCETKEGRAASCALLPFLSVHTHWGSCALLLTCTRTSSLCTVSSSSGQGPEFSASTTKLPNEMNETGSWAATAPCDTTYLRQPQAWSPCLATNHYKLERWRLLEITIAARLSGSCGWQ